MSKGRILYADDDPDTREMVKMYLQMAGFRVDLATTSREVLDTIAEEQFDAVILDNWMPEATGVETCKLIRLIDQTTPIFFCSGAASAADIKEATDAGAQGYFTKPFDPDDLVKALQRALGIRCQSAT
jgi:DNA-binding response OmpR family regulator